ncbi:MAG: hypothetical protein JJE52_16785 [Acidimicrobiia bacterium]|nr:hypothetical protein [Acidimicrobiia bacterium]
MAGGAVVGALVLGAIAMLAGVAWVGLVLGAAVGAAMALWQLRGTSARVLTSVGAVPIAAGSEPRLRNLVDGLCTSNGVSIPDLSVIEDDAINCLAVGASPQHTTIVVTRGMLAGLDRMQLEGVVAWLLGQVKRGETRLATVITPVAALAPRLAARALPERYDVIADLDAVGLTRYPPGLLAALEVTRSRSAVARAPQSSNHLWFDDPAGGTTGVGAAFHSSIDERIATLQEL